MQRLELMFGPLELRMRTPLKPVSTVLGEN
jgi:hypothetical protein